MCKLFLVDRLQLRWQQAEHAHALLPRLRYRSVRLHRGDAAARSTAARRAETLPRGEPGPCHAMSRGPTARRAGAPLRGEPEPARFSPCGEPEPRHAVSRCPITQRAGAPPRGELEPPRSTAARRAGALPRG